MHSPALIQICVALVEELVIVERVGIQIEGWVYLPFSLCLVNINTHHY